LGATMTEQHKIGVGVFKVLFALFANWLWLANYYDSHQTLLEVFALPLQTLATGVVWESLFVLWALRAVNGELANRCFGGFWGLWLAGWIFFLPIAIPDGVVIALVVVPVLVAQAFWLHCIRLSEAKLAKDKVELNTAEQKYRDRIAKTPADRSATDQALRDADPGDDFAVDVRGIERVIGETRKEKSEER
jgi:hypothetical protein